MRTTTSTHHTASGKGRETWLRRPEKASRTTCSNKFAASIGHKVHFCGSKRRHRTDRRRPGQGWRPACDRSSSGVFFCFAKGLTFLQGVLQFPYKKVGIGCSSAGRPGRGSAPAVVLAAMGEWHTGCYSPGSGADLKRLRREERDVSCTPAGSRQLWQEVSGSTRAVGLSIFSDRSGRGPRLSTGPCAAGLGVLH